MEELQQELERVRAQQRTWEFAKFHEETAWELGLFLRNQAKEHHYPIAISVTLNHRRLFYCSMPGAAPINDCWVQRKENLVYLFQKPSYEMALSMRLKKDTLANRYGLCSEDYAAAGGSIPLLVRGTGMVGTVTVSGLSEREDHELVAGAVRNMTQQ